MGFWFIPMLASMAGSGAGALAQNAATKEGARANANIQGLSLAFQKQIQEKELARTQPFSNLGLGALPALGAFANGTYDPSKNLTVTRPSPVTGAQDILFSGNTANTFNKRYNTGQLYLGNLGQRAGFNPTSAIKNLYNNIYADEYGAQRGRLIDRIKIGQGSAESTGGNYTRASGALSGIFQNLGATNASLAQQRFSNNQQVLGNFFG